jgi:CYTH domain-containing protein
MLSEGVYISPCPERNRITERVLELGGHVVPYPNKDTIVLLTERQYKMIQERPPGHLVSSKLYRAEAIEQLPLKEQFRVKIKGFDQDGKRISSEKRSRAAYTNYDDGMILYYLQEVVGESKKNKAVNIFSDEIWKKVERKFVCSTHSWQSMQERYINRLEGVSEFERNRLLKLVMANDAGRQKPQVDQPDEEKQVEEEEREEELTQEKRVREPSPEPVKSKKRVKKEEAATEKEEFASEDEIRKALDIMKKMHPDISLEKITHALICTSGNFNHAIDYLATGNLKNVWTYEEDNALLGAKKEKILELKRPHDGLLSRAKFLSSKV